MVARRGATRIDAATRRRALVGLKRIEFGIRLVVIRVRVAVRALRLCSPIGPDVHPDATTPAEAIDIAEVNPPVHIKRVGAEPDAWSVRLDPDTLVEALPVARHHTIPFAESAIESKHAHHLRHNRVNRLKLTGDLVAFSERRERHELLTSIQKLPETVGVTLARPGGTHHTRGLPVTLTVGDRTIKGRSSPSKTRIISIAAS